MKTIRIGNFVLSSQSPTLVVAEAACNHMCRLDLAKRMIEGAREAGANAVKFQTYKAERLVLRNAQAYWNHPGVATASQFEYYKNLDRFGRDDYELLFDYAREQGIIAFSTPFDTASASMLNELGVPLFKIASCDLPDVRLVRLVARFGKPMIMSTGGATLDEIRRAVETVHDAGNADLVLLVCTLSYPTENRDAHLRRILAMKEAFPDCLVGLSDHTRPDSHMVIPALAVALGAKVIEKHYTLDRTMTGSGHAHSVDPGHLRKMVENIRLAETVLGSPEIRVLEMERAARTNARRSLVAERPIAKGARIFDADVGIKRPGTGLTADRIDEVIGRVAKKKIDQDTPIELEALE